MRLSIGVSALNWRYALGELILIIAGVFVALAASDWQKNRDARRTEIQTLHEIRRALTDDIDALSRLAEHSRKSEEQLREILKRLDSAETGTDDIGRQFGMLYCLNRPLLNNAVYESLKYTSLLQINSDPLRAKIAQLYEVSYRRVKQELDSERFIVWEVVGPYVREYFHDVRPCQSATPLDLAQLGHDQYFRNMVELFLNGQTMIYGPTWHAAIEYIRQLLLAIDAELEN
jgi:hypothetical protein